MPSGKQRSTATQMSSAYFLTNKWGIVGIDNGTNAKAFYNTTSIKYVYPLTDKPRNPNRTGVWQLSWPGSWVDDAIAWYQLMVQIRKLRL